jgi:hypothetical protein
MYIASAQLQLDQSPAMAHDLSFVTRRVNRPKNALSFGDDHAMMLRILRSKWTWRLPFGSSSRSLKWSLLAVKMTDIAR